MMRKNVKRAVPSASGGMSSRTMYRSRTRNLTALLYHSDVHRLSQLLAVALVLAALAGLGDAVLGASGVPDRLDRFRELALIWRGRVQTGAELTADAYREMYALLDEEIVESLTSGGPYASPGFLQDRLDAFGGVWGGTTLGVVGVDHLVVGAFQLADATDVNTVRVYGRLHGEAALLGTLHREGRPVVHRAASAPGEAPQFVAAWEGAPSGRGTRALRLELARQVGDGVRVVWSTAELFPDGLLARSYSVRPKEIRVRYELRYPGWTPGCEARTEAEDLYRLVSDTGVFARTSRTYHQPWHRELHATVWRLFEALGGGDHAKPGKPFSIVMPPPNVTGSLHWGHALDMTLQDVLVRMKRMDGFNTLWLPGTDHAGIAVHVVLERQLAAEGKTRQDIGREAFLDRAWQWKEETGGTIIRQLKRLGASCDWSRERFTMDPGLSRAVREAFVRLWEEGLIYRDDYIVNWCPRCQTVLSDLEVEREERDAEFGYIKYGPLTLGTVRPETKLGDTGLAVHPKDKRYAQYVGKTLEVPSVDGTIAMRVVADEAVDPKFGTGVINVTPGHDPVDFEIGKRHGLPIRTVIGFDGRMTAAAGRYAGLDRFECRTRIVEDMKALGLIERIEPYRHTVGVCYRCKTVVEPLVSKQWWVSTKPLADPAIKAVRDGRIKIIQRSWTKTYYHWMENIRPWCISRQLWWGHRIPAWHCDRCDAVHVSRTDLATCPRCGGPVRQDPDVLDTWFSSGLWPFSTMEWPDDTPMLRTYYPTAVLVTGFDILFFWVARMAMLGLHFMQQVPFHDVYIHALVRDAVGQKMSKSKGNVADPLEVMDKYGTDAFRFTLTALAGLGRDIRISDERIEGYRNFANKLWNAARLVLSNLDGYDAANARKAEPAPADRWIQSRLAATVGSVRAALRRYRFNDAASAVYQFVWHEYCDWYLELAKLSLYRAVEPAERLRTQHTR